MHTLRLTFVAFLLGVTQLASAQSPVVLSFSSQPENRVFVTPRLTGALPGCPPERAELVLEERYSGELRLIQGPNTSCGAVVVDSDITLAPIAFPTMGIYTIRMVDEAGVFLTQEVAVQGQIINGEVGTFGKFSADGTWYAPEISGSGLIMTHRREPTAEHTFGTWFNFDGDARARWHSLQEGRWITPSILSGAIYQSRGYPQDCELDPGDSDCPESLRARAASATEKLGRYELEMLDESNAILRFEMDSGAQHETRLRKLL